LVQLGGAQMISINYRDPRPVYEQVRDGFKKLIFSGVLGENDKLPSVRILASQLAINPNTIQRAYAELEAEGFIYSSPGKGSFVAGINRDEKKIEACYEKLDALCRELELLGVSAKEIADRIRKGDNE